VKYRWKIAEKQSARATELAQAAGISPLLAQCLINRGIDTPELIHPFLHPRLKQLADPFLLPNMHAAVERLLVAREKGEQVVIFGDYDVDGVTATAILLECLSALGWKLSHYLPHRMDEGYGFSADAVGHCLEQHPASLILAVDCGSTAVETIASVKSKGIDVIVLDHHQLSVPAPAAAALVNPQLGDRFHELCSAGLAFKLVHALLKKMRAEGLVDENCLDLRLQLDLVVLGTVADLAPLRGENRIFAAAGLERLNATRRPGLVALKAVARCPAKIGSYEIAFQLAPRLNAAGRMQNADEALRLVLARDLPEAEALANNLHKRNQERQETERQICAEVIATVRERFNAEADFVIVEGEQHWHLGVVGIVAARVLQEFHRPTIILGGDNGMWRGSGRSIEGFDLAAALRECGEYLSRHGGHAMAAGLTVAPEHLVALRARLNDLARRSLKPEHLQPSILVDASVLLAELTEEQIVELALLEPVGQGNPPVRLALCGMRHAHPPRRMGRDEQHAKFRVSDGRKTMEAVWWNAGEGPWPEGEFDLAFTAAMNEYQGRRMPQLRVLDWRA
jgi:single-stranded-DNA-specific exonuclease